MKDLDDQMSDVANFLLAIEVDGGDPTRSISHLVSEVYKLRTENAKLRADNSALVDEVLTGKKRAEP